MLCSSLAHAPRSMSLQRSQQKGRKALSLVQAVDFLQVGQETIVVGLLSVIVLFGAFCQFKIVLVQC